MLAFGRPPQYDERQAVLAFLQRQSRLARTVVPPPPPAAPPKPPTAAIPTTVAQTQDAALADLCHALFNTNEFCYVE
jgi:hypothetical protein